MIFLPVASVSNGFIFLTNTVRRFLHFSLQLCAAEGESMKRLIIIIIKKKHAFKSNRLLKIWMNVRGINWIYIHLNY